MPTKTAKAKSAKNIGSTDATNVEDDGAVESTVYSRENVLKQISKEISKEYGKDVFISGSEIVERPKQVIPVSPAIDAIIGGGVPEGSWFTLSGKYKCGKSSMSLHFAKNAQKEEYGGRQVYFLNVEGRIKRRDLTGIHGLDPAKVQVIESTEDVILTSQDYLTIASNILKTDKKCVMIIDSVSRLCDEREMTGGIGTQTRGSGAIVVNQFMSTMSNVVPVKNHIVICILQLMANTGYGASTFEKGGNAVQFQSDIKLVAGSVNMWKPNDTAPPVGQEIEWAAHWSALGSPMRKTTSYLRYGHGIDEEYENIILACDVGLITEPKKSYFQLDFMRNHLDILGVEKWDDDDLPKGIKHHGKEKLRLKLLENPDWYEIMLQDLKEWR